MTSDLLKLMKRFRIAYAKADREELLNVVTEDFCWRQHKGELSDRPGGRLLQGVDELLGEIERRGQHWSDVVYEGMEERAAQDLLVQTFTIRGYEDGVPFHARVVDLYPVVDGRIAMKDTYWKQSSD